MAGDELAAWLRAEIESDGKSAGARLRRQMSDDYRRVQMEKLARAKAELAILGLCERQAAKSGENAMEEDRAWTLDPVVRLLAFGYRRREGCPESEDDLRDFYFLRTEGR
jgi:hypothetical protein